MKNNIIIIGCGRSGTSMIAGSIKGKYNRGGTLIQPDNENPKGYFESNTIAAINDEMLWSCPFVETTQGTRHGWLTCLDSTLSLFLYCGKNIGDRIKNITKNQPILIKDPRMSYTLNLWLKELDNVKVVCAFRHPAEFLMSVIHNCKTQQYLKNVVIDENFFQKVWLDMNNYILTNYVNTGLDILFLHYDQVLYDNGLEKLSNFTECEIDKNFPESKLKRSNENYKIPYNMMYKYYELCDLAGYPVERLV